MSEPLHIYRPSSQGMSRVARFLANRQLHKLAQEHHGAGFPQMAIFSHDHIGHVINIEGRYEDDYLNAAFQWLSAFSKDMAKSTALDIGANIGNHSLFFSQHFRSVHAFEPNPRTFELLKFNAAQAGNVTPHRQALSDSEGSGILHENPTNNGGTYVELSSSENGSQLSQPILLGTLDRFVEANGVDNIGLIKIDTEGFETKVLRGAKGVIGKYRPIIIFELSPSDFGPDGSEAVNFLSGVGYEFVSVDKNYRFGHSDMARYAGFFLRILLGERLFVRPVSYFKAGFFQMIIAVHHDVLTVSPSYHG